MSSLARAFRRLTDSLTGAGSTRDQNRALQQQQRAEQEVAQNRQLSEQQRADEDNAKPRRRRRGRRLFLSEESGGVGSSLGGV